MSLPTCIPVVSPKISRRVFLPIVTLLLITALFAFQPGNFDESTVSIWYLNSVRPPSSSLNAALSAEVDWSRFAYVQYATNSAYLCNSVMLFEILSRLQSRAERLLMYPSIFRVDGDSTSTESRLLRKARDEYNVKLMPIEIQSRNGDDSTWSASYTKLLAFNQTQYDRVLSLDSDSIVLQTMDELFLSPPAPVAMPRAYWLEFNDRILCSSVILIQPSKLEFRRVTEAISKAASSEYDMEIVNNLYRDSAMIIPHRPYTLLTGEFWAKRHTDYIGNSDEEWDPERIFSEAKFLHFSDWPVPKPWITANPSLVEQQQPTCEFNNATGQDDDCRARDIWLAVYQDFATRRKVDHSATVSPFPSKKRKISHIDYRNRDQQAICNLPLIR